MRWLVRGLWCVIAVCLMPLAGVLWSAWFASRHGCRLNESGVHPCFVGGTDYGEVLAAAFISGWFMIATLPIAAVCVVILLVLGIARWIKRRAT